MKDIAATVSVSLKYPVTEKKLTAIINSGKTEDKYLPHIFALFTDVPVADLFFFVGKNHISLPVFKTYYQMHVKKFYPNHELEEALAVK